MNTPESQTVSTPNSPPIASSRPAARKAKAATTKTATTGPSKPVDRRQSKQDLVLALLRRKEGATVATIMKSTGWQPHSVRGFFAGIVRKKLKLNLISQETDGKRTYRLAAIKPDRSGRSKRKRAR